MVTTEPYTQGRGLLSSLELPTGVTLRRWNLWHNLKLLGTMEGFKKAPKVHNGWWEQVIAQVSFSIGDRELL